MTADLLRRLHLRYPRERGWCLETEVPSGRGGGRLDALAVNVYSSRGYQRIGFELKVSRADWLRELRDPGKAEAAVAMVHEWYLVVPSSDIVQEGELPAGWGLMVRCAKTLKIVHKAKRRDPGPLGQTLASILIRRSWDQAEKRAVDRAEKLVLERAARDGTSTEAMVESLKVEREKVRGLEHLLQVLGWYGIKNADGKVTIAGRPVDEIKDLLGLLKESQEDPEKHSHLEAVLRRASETLRNRHQDELRRIEKETILIEKILERLRPKEKS